MTASRVGRVIAVAAIAFGVAGAGAAVNLRLISSHDQPIEPLGLSTTDTLPGDSSGNGPGTTGAPPSTTPPVTEPGSTSTGSTTSAPTTAPAVAGATSYHVGAAGTVELAVNGGSISVVAVQVTRGWTYETKHASGDEVELEFRRSSDGAETSFHARLEGGQLRVETEDEGPDD